MSLEIAVAKPGDAAAFWQTNDRAWRSEAWGFKVVWHEQTHDITASVDGAIVGALNLRIAASLAHVEALYVVPAQRGSGVGRALLSRCEELANYYNCHKVSAAVMNDGPAMRFFTGSGYHVEAVLPQHTFKLDVAMVRKFLL
ncbi:MAG TPA: GNAT family N-acetyltransferase [Candidatus Lustribacter sp.]|jgi:GNAT superfamily N-acetyltransferase|nr:GNAT family N-acetyltransferase [Candidatus Lustribacter sp.]